MSFEEEGIVQVDQEELRQLFVLEPKNQYY